MKREDIPAADPDNPETRLLRVIFGLCPDCDITDEHCHGSWVNGEYFSLKRWATRPSGQIEYVYSIYDTPLKVNDGNPC